MGKRVDELTEATSVLSTDLLLVEYDPSSSKLSKKITISNFLKSLGTTGDYVSRGVNTDIPTVIKCISGETSSPRTGDAVFVFQDKYKNTASGGNSKTSYRFDGYHIGTATGPYSAFQIFGSDQVNSSATPFVALHVAAAYEGVNPSTYTGTWGAWFQASDGGKDHAGIVGLEIATDTLYGDTGTDWWTGPARKAGLQVVDSVANWPGSVYYFSHVGAFIRGYRTGVGIFGYKDTAIHIYTPLTATTGTGILIDQSIATGINLASGTFSSAAINATGKTCYFGNTFWGNSQAFWFLNNAGAAYKNMMYFDTSDTLVIGSELATGHLKINIDGTVKTLSIDGSGFVKAA